MKHIKQFNEELGAPLEDVKNSSRSFLNGPTTTDIVSDRKEITQRVIDCLIKDQNNHAGYQSFREELEDFLSTFPKE